MRVRICLSRAKMIKELASFDSWDRFLTPAWWCASTVERVLLVERFLNHVEGIHLFKTTRRERWRRSNAYKGADDEIGSNLSAHARQHEDANTPTAVGQIALESWRYRTSNKTDRTHHLERW